MNAMRIEKSDVVPLPVNTDIYHKLLLHIGIPPHVLGYEYIICALELIAQNPDLLHNVTKGLYIDIAIKQSSTPTRVERAIRHAISAAWLYGDINFTNELFQHSVRPDKGTPTNSMFLARLYYYIRNKEFE